MRPLAEAVAPARHSLFEDFYALLTGCAFLVIGLMFLNAAGLVTGGIAGLALIISYFIAWPPGLIFTLLNIPFFLAGGRVLGSAALVKSLIANLLIAAFALGMPLAFRLENVDGLFAALFGGTLIGAGILLLARHQVGVGGLGILALVLQRLRGRNAGRTQLIGDAMILGVSLPLLGLGPKLFSLSALSAVAVSGVLIVFHKPGRYTGY